MRFRITDLLLVTSFIGLYLGPIGSLVRKLDVQGRTFLIVAGVICYYLAFLALLLNRGRFGRPWLRLGGRRNWFAHFGVGISVVAACLLVSAIGDLHSTLALYLLVAVFSMQLYALAYPDTCFYEHHAASVYWSHTATPEAFALRESPEACTLALLNDEGQPRREWPVPPNRVDEVRAILAEKQLPAEEAP